MKLQLKIFFLITILFPLAGWAGVKLIVWKPHPSAPAVVLPQLDGETPIQAADRYLQTIRTEPGLASLRYEGFRLDLGQAFLLPAEKPGGQVRLALIANRLQHLTHDDGRIQWISKRFISAGADAFVLGLSADLGLKESDAAEFREKVVQNFSLLVSLGGDDISPELYGEKITYAKNTNILRDRSELALVKHYKKSARGVFFGICRGHQMGAVADGHKLHQDLSLTQAGTSDYHGNQNGRNFSEAQTWHHIIFEDSLLARFLNGKTNPQNLTYSIQVNSVHHQAVDPKDSADSKVIALDDRDGTVEALQGKNNKSFSVQFHPEFPQEISGNEEFSMRGLQVLRGIVTYSRLIRMQNREKACASLRLLNSNGR